jgi:hypothetical protein
MFINRYTEAIPYLYSANTFELWQSYIIQHMPRLLLPQRIDMIRSLTFHWHLNLDPGQILEQASQETDPRLIGLPGIWETIWENLSAMKSLHTLHVKLDVHALYWRHLNQDFATRLLRPIEKVVGPKEFVLSLPFSVMDGSRPVSSFEWNIGDEWQGDPWEALPCTIRRVGLRKDL